MIKKFNEYFIDQHTFFLNHATYQRLEDAKESNLVLNVTDSLQASKEDNMVRIFYKRVIFFEPECLYRVEVEFGAILTIKEEMMSSAIWEEIDLSEEFKENGDFVINNLVGRASHIIGDLTASYGQSPIITPPTLIK